MSITAHRPSSPESLDAIPLAMPLLASGLGEHAKHVGFSAAVSQVLDEANIHLQVDGDLADSAGKGLLIAGDHRHRLEPLLVQAVTHKAGRGDSHVLAMPTSLAGRFMQASGPDGKRLILPVIPTAFARDNPTKPDGLRQRVRDARYPNVFNHTKKELVAINRAAIGRAAGEIAAGGTVTLFPTGKTNQDAGQGTWHSGFGSIVRALPQASLETAQLAVLRPDTFPVAKVAAAIALSRLGVRPSSQEITIRTEVLGTPLELFGDLVITDDPAAAHQISDITKTHYQRVFPKQ